MHIFMRETHKINDRLTKQHFVQKKAYFMQNIYTNLNRVVKLKMLFGIEFILY